MSNYHSRMTSIGTKRAIRPYWAKYHRGKEKALGCPFHELCLDLAWGAKRTLYAHACPYCRDQIGYPKAQFLELHKTYDWEIYKKEKPDNWMVEMDKVFQERKREILLKS